MDKIEQAAVLLFSMGEQQASQILKYMDHKQVEKLITCVNKLEGINQKEIVSSLNKFFKDSTRLSGLGESSGDFIRNALVSAVGNEKATSLIDKAAFAEKGRGLEMLTWQPAKVIAEMLADEHPQVIVIAMTYLDGEKAAETLQLLPKENYVGMLEKMTKVGQISPVALQVLSSVLEQKITEMDSYKQIPLGGVDGVADIVNFLDSEIENDVLNGISEKDEDLATQIQDRMFPFEKLVDVDDRSLQTLLRDVPNEDMVAALKGVDESLRDVFFRNMSERASDMLKDDLEASGPMQIGKVLDAQKRIVAVAKNLAKEGKIVIASKGGDDMVM